MSSQSQVETKHRLTSDGVWRFAWKYSDWIIVFIAILIGISVGLVFGNMVTGSNAFMWTFVTLYSTIFLGRMLYSRRFAGNTVKDYGKQSLWLLKTSTSVILPLFLYYLKPEFMIGPFKYLPSYPSYFFTILFWCSISLLLIIHIVSPLQLRENCINLYSLFLDWDWIGSYYWDSERHVLYLKGKHQIFHYMLLSRPFRIASKHRDIVNELLNKHIGQETPR